MQAGLLYLAVREQLTPGSSGPADRRSSSEQARSPLRLDMLDLAQESVELFVTWASIAGGSVTHGQRNQAGRTDGAFARAVAVLLERHDSIVRSDLAPAYASDLRRWSARVRRATGQTIKPQRIPLPCSVCDLRGLSWYPAEGYLKCSGCGSSGDLLIAHGLKALIESEAVTEEV
jgi:hypothetical protein